MKALHLLCSPQTLRCSWSSKCLLHFQTICRIWPPHTQTNLTQGSTPLASGETLHAPVVAWSNLSSSTETVLYRLVNPAVLNHDHNLITALPCHMDENPRSPRKCTPRGESRNGDQSDADSQCVTGQVENFDFKVDQKNHMLFFCCKWFDLLAKDWFVSKGLIC